MIYTLPMNKDLLKRLYINQKLSSFEISRKLNCSPNKINYWLSKFQIPKRNQSDATYFKKNPRGDPFSFSYPESYKKMFLYGLGIGLFWGEGTKKNSHSVRLCNSDPNLIKKFIEFLVVIYKVEKSKFRFQLQTYDVKNISEHLTFWQRTLKMHKSQFYKPTILKKRGAGTYTEKSEHGTLIVIFGNTKLRNLICNKIVNIDQV